MHSRRCKTSLVGQSAGPSIRLGRRIDSGENPKNRELKSTFEHIKLLAKLLNYFLRRNKSNINHQLLKPSMWKIGPSAASFPGTKLTLGNPILFAGISKYIWKLLGIRWKWNLCTKNRHLVQSAYRSANHDVLSLREVNADGREQMRLYTCIIEHAQQ